MTYFVRFLRLILQTIVILPHANIAILLSLKIHGLKQNKNLFFSHRSVSTDDPMLAGRLSGVRTFFFILFCNSCFSFILGFIVKDGSCHIYLPASAKRESKKTVRGEVEEKFLLFSIHKPEIVYITSICIT